MAESVSDQKVEDMLSSVRRLVSSELPRNQRPRMKETGSALVLTEAHRVEPKAPIQGQRGMTLEERIAELEAAVAGQSSEWEPDGSEDQDEHRPDRIVFRPSRQRDEDEARRPLRLSEISKIETGPAVEDTQPSAESADGLDSVAVSFDRGEYSPASAEDAAADGQSAVVTAEVDPKKDPAPPAELAGDPFADAIARDVAAVVAEMSKTAAMEDNDFQAVLAEAVLDPAETRSTDRQVAGQPESLEEAAQDRVEDVGADHEVASTPLEVSADAAHEESEPQTAPEVGDPAPDVDAHEEQGAHSASLATGDDTSREQRARDLAGEDVGTENLLTLTPQQLRLLISSMIRDELQGELGERITRNVRKLVRQEVHRALSVRDLE